MLTCVFCSDRFRRTRAALCSGFVGLAACAPGTDATPLQQTASAASGASASGGSVAPAGAAGVPGRVVPPVAGGAPLAASTAGSSGRVSTAAAAGAGVAGQPGAAVNSGASAATGGTGAAAGSGMAGASGSAAAASGETGRMVGMTDAHNAVRARATNPTPNPALPPLTWSSELAAIAQAYAEKLAAGGDCLDLVHSMDNDLGENLSGSTGAMDTPKAVVDGWADEAKCYTFGEYKQSDKCDMACTSQQNSSGCGHYTQLVWRDTSEVGCGMATCGSGRGAGEVWVCNYKEGGNFIGDLPY